MKKTIILMLVFMASTFTASAGGKRTDNRNLRDFTQIENNTAYDVRYYESDSYRVNVVGNPADVSNILTTMRGNTLSISTRDGARFTGKPYIEVYCPKKKLVNYTGRGKGNFIAKTAITLLSSLISLSGSGNANIGQVVATNLNLVTTGAGNIKVRDAKVSGDHTIQQSGTGRVTFNGQTQTTTIQNSGSGNTKGHVDTNRFEGKSTSTGNINMKGNAPTITMERQGSGQSNYRRR